MKSNMSQQAGRLLGEAGLRRTRARMRVLNALLKSAKPCTADELCESMGKTSPDRVTVYRILERLVAANIVHRAFVKGRSCYYEPAHNCTEQQCHPHFTCTGCGVTHCLRGMSLPMATSPYKGYVIRRQQVRLEGLCPACA
jgi:Fur family ferric uptake transcriptional regulator